MRWRRFFQLRAVLCSLVFKCAPLFPACRCFILERYLFILRCTRTAHLALVPQTALAPGAAGLDSDPQLRAAHDTLLRADILDRVAPAARETRTICRGLLVCAVDISSRGERGEPQSDSKLLDHVLTLNRSIGVTDRHRFLQRRRAGTRRYEYISSSLKQASVEGSQNAATDWGAVLEYLLAEPAVGLDCTPRSPEVSKALLKVCAVGHMFGMPWAGLATYFC